MAEWIGLQANNLIKFNFQIRVYSHLDVVCMRLADMIFN